MPPDMLVSLTLSGPLMGGGWRFSQLMEMLL
jgi:hypothetical protein